MKSGLLVTLLILLVPGTGMAQSPFVSTAKQSKGVSLTVYNQNFAVVREKRLIPFQKGNQVLRFEDVAALIDPTSISLKALGYPGSVVVREQNYQYDLLNPTSILNKSVGKTVRFKQVKPDGKVEILEGTLLNPPTATVSNGEYSNTTWQGLVLRTNDGRLVLNPSGEVIVEEMPSGLVSRPSLVWKVDATRAGDQETEVSYMTNGITWKADYVAVISKDETKVDLTGWVTLDNRSGATYEQAQLQLLAGDVRRVQEGGGNYGYEDRAMMMKTAEAPAPQFQEESFFEYHLYTLDGRTTMQNNETKQLTLLTANDVSVQRKLVLDAGRPVWYSYRGGQGRGSSTDKNKLNIMLELKNSKDNNMGMPLPKGKVRVYKADDRGNLQFLGEDLIDHTPKDETVRLYIGDAFDVTGERKQTDFSRISDRVSEESWQITVKNHKDSKVDVWITEHQYGDWKVTKNSHPFTKVDATTMEFPITIEKNGSVTVSYTVRRSW